MRRALAGLCMVVCVAGLVSAQPKDKDKGGKATKDAPRVKATIVKVDAPKKMLYVTMDGKKVDLTVGKDVQFIGPKGGIASQGLKDRRLKPGVVLGLVIDEKSKTLKEVHIPTI